MTRPKDGHTPEQKAARAAYQKAWRAERKDDLSAKSRGYRETHKEEISAQRKGHREANKAAEAARSKAWREANKDHVNAHAKAYYAEHRDARRAASKAYKEASGDVCRARGRAHYAANREAVRTRQRDARYGLTPTQYADMSARQNGLCAACDISPATHVDHNHATGEVRELLCGQCNSAEGLLHGLAGARKLVAYLERHQVRLAVAT